LLHDIRVLLTGRGFDAMINHRRSSIIPVIPYGVMNASRHPKPASLVKVTAEPLDTGPKEQLAMVARALGDPHRIEIVHVLALAAEPVCVIDLEHHLGLAQSTVSHHLKVLVDAGICDREPRGRWTYYSLRPRTLAEFRHRLEDLVHFPEIAVR
jgi:ArsR family transcriptional regulator